MKERLLKTQTTREEIFTMIRTSLEFAFEDPQFSDAYSVSYRDYQYLSDEHKKSIGKYNTEYRLFLTDIMVRAKKEGVITNDPNVLFHFINGAITHAPKWFRPDGPLNIDQLADEFYKIAVKQHEINHKQDRSF
jgi:hypothetical protein